MKIIEIKGLSVRLEVHLQNTSKVSVTETVSSFYKIQLFTLPETKQHKIITVSYIKT